MRVPLIVVVGSSNTDLVIRSARLPRPGQTVLDGEFQIMAGGKGANQAVAAARAGARVTFVANIGRDDFGDASLKRLRREGINTRFVVRSRAAPSGIALICVGENGENLISVARSSNDELTPNHVRAAEAAIRAARCLVAQIEVPLNTVKTAMLLARRHGVPVLLNPAPAKDLPTSLLRLVHFLTPNEVELAHLTGRSGTRKADVIAGARQLLALGAKHVLVTCGARGVCWCNAEAVRWFTPPKVKAIDTVGAGDCFSGVLAASLARGESMDDAIRFAVVAAAISVTRPGAQPSMPSRNEIVSKFHSWH
ncbi:MAG: ribokinase [Verrucomicrobia bacterium]|nr:ribokinase [Verrucomicrobiota bacterium]